jgi:hypothetical protein
LIDLGVNINSVSKAGTTPFARRTDKGTGWAASWFKEGVELLLKHGADPC